MKYFYKTTPFSHQFKYIAFACGLILLLTASCEDFVEIELPRTEIIAESVFDNEEAATSAMNGIYSEMMFNTNNLFNTSLEVYTGTASDELINYSSEQDNTEFGANDVSPFNGTLNNSFWQFAYSTINKANTVIEGLQNSPLEGLVRNQIQGEAFFIRAMTHFYLTNLFGDIPYVNTTDFEVNSGITKDDVALVYQKITEDLLLAQSQMIVDYSFVSNEQRVRPNQAATTALLARVYLYQQDWSNAEIQATSIIENSLFTLDSLNGVFLPESKEAIWQLQPNRVLEHTRHGTIFNLLAEPGTIFFFTTALSKNLIQAFDTSDNRLSDWVGVRNSGENTFFYPFKYKLGFQDVAGEIPDEFVVVLRLAEQYLIRAEARAQQGNISGAQEDLNAIRNRAGLDNTTASDQPSLLVAILEERRFELFAEWGHRWFDLKRTGRANEVLAAIPEKDWQNTDVLWPIPEEELLNNPNLLPQNPGY